MEANGNPPQRTRSLTVNKHNMHNVHLALAFTFASNAARGVWAFSVLSGYLYVLVPTNKNSKVGFAEGIQGIAQAICAILAGFLADSWRRDRTLALGAVVGLIAAAVTVLALLWQNTIVDGYRFQFICFAVGIWGTYQGIWNTSLETIYADSLATGTRSQYNTYKFILTLIASVTGPLLAVILFLWKGNSWGLVELRDVFVIGIGCSLPSIFMCCFFNDKLMLGKKAERDRYITQTTIQDDGVGYVYTNPGCSGYLRQHVPHVTIATDIISGIGTGMTVKFFPLFFKNKVQLSPVSVNLIYVFVPFAMAAGSYAAKALSIRIGRPATCTLYGLIGATALASLSVLGNYFDWTRAEIYIPIYIVSTAQHCCRPLKKSILMDAVKANERARWNSLDSVSRFGWSGSAYLGGYLVDKYGYGATFYITASLQVASALVWALLIPILPPERIETSDTESSFSEADSHTDSIRDSLGTQRSTSVHISETDITKFPGENEKKQPSLGRSWYF